MMTSARSHRCPQACLQGEQQNLHPAMVSAEVGVPYALMGQSILRYSLYSSKASIWHPLEQLCPGEGQRLGEKNRLIRDMVAFPHQLSHCASAVPFMHQRPSAPSPKPRQVANPLSVLHGAAYEGQSCSFQTRSTESQMGTW